MHHQRIQLLQGVSSSVTHHEPPSGSTRHLIFTTSTNLSWIMDSVAADHMIGAFTYTPFTHDNVMLRMFHYQSCR